MRDEVHDEAVDGFGPTELAANRLLTALRRHVVAQVSERTLAHQVLERLPWTERQVHARILALWSRPYVEFALAWRLIGQPQTRMVHSAHLSSVGALTELVDVFEFQTGRTVG